MLKTSVHALKHDQAYAAQLFYCRLFSRCPRLRRLFGGKPDFDGARLLWALNAVIGALSEPQRFVGLLTLFTRPSVRDAFRHGDCMGALGDALQWMLLKHRPGHPQHVRDAWQVAHREIADVIASGGRLQAGPLLEMHPSSSA